MIISFQGENYFKLQSGSITSLLDPLDKRSFKGAAFIVNTVKPAYAETPSADEKSSSEAPIWIDHQGEYEVQGIHIQGWSTGFEDKQERTAYKIIWDEITIVCLGHISRELSPNLIGELGSPDIVIIPAGAPFIKESAAAKLLRQLEPSIIIPSLYKKEPKGFLKELGKENIKPIEKLVIKKKELAPKAMNVVLLETL